MGFNRTAVKSAVEDLGSGRAGASESPDQLELRLKHAASDSFEQFFRQPTAVLCGSYQKGIPSLVRVYEQLSAAGMRVLSPSGLDFVVEIGELVPNEDGAENSPEAIEWLPLNCIRAADLVWLHAPDGFVGLNGALEIGFANAAGVAVYAEEMPNDLALRSLVTISPLEQVIAETSSRERDTPRASLLPLQGHYSAFAGERTHEPKSAHDIMLLITEEIGDLSRQNPGQRQGLSRTS
jgi:hypothetical protein